MLFKHVLATLLIFQGVLSLDEANLISSRGETDPRLAFHAWSSIQNNFTLDIDLFTFGLASKLDQFLDHVNITQRCRNGLKTIFESAKLKQNWALKGKLFVE